MNIKRIACMLLTLVMVLTLAACDSSPTTADGGDTNKSEVDIDTLADAERADFPKPAGEYDAVLSHVQMDKKTLDVYLGKMIVAYGNLEDEEFCKYVYELNQTHDEYLLNTYGAVDSMSQMLMLEGNGENADKSRALVNFNLMLTTYRNGWKSWDVDYLSIGINKDAPTYKELKDGAKKLINEFSNMLYGKDMV